MEFINAAIAAILALVALIILVITAPPVGGFYE